MNFVEQQTEPREHADKVRKIPKQQRALETKKRLLAAAHNILIDEGIDALTTRRLAAVSGMSVGTIYVYFPTKEALLFWVFETRLKDRLSHFDATVGQSGLGGSGKEQVDAFLGLMAAQGMWSKLDLELRNAEEKVPALKAYTKWFEDELTSRYVAGWKRLGATMNDRELSLLAEYAHSLDHLNMKMQQGRDRESRRFVGEVTTKIFHELSRLTGATYDVPLG